LIVALGYFGKAETEFGAAAIILASDEGRYLTDQAIKVDGDQLM